MSPPSALRSPGLLASLRESTRAAHESLDSGLGLAKGPVDRDRYVAFLRGSLAIVAPLEERLARWFGPPDEGPRGPRLRSDLESLGESPPFDRAPETEVPELRTRAEAYGAAYVVEGSALGGLFLAKRLASAFAPESLRYLTYRGDDTKEHWRRFVAAMDRWGESQPESARGEACVTASTTFAAYARAFERAGALAVGRR